MLEPGILATLAAKAREEEAKAGADAPAPPVAADPETEAKEAEKRRKRAEKKARKKDEKRREKAEATASTSSGSGSARAVAPEGSPGVSEPVSRDDVDDVSVSAARLEATPASTPPTRAPSEAAVEAPRAGKETPAVPARRPRGALKTRGKPRTVLGLTEEQRGWVAIAIALVAMCVLAIAGAIGGVRA